MPMTTIIEKRQDAIYSNYRRTLTSLRKRPGSRDSRSAARKQEAREITADRYSVPISTVKKIVQAFELEEGITHEHTNEYLNELKIQEAHTKAIEDALKVNPDRICESCGCTSTDEIETPDGRMIARGEVRVRFEIVHYESTGEIRFKDVCYPCWIGYGL